MGLKERAAALLGISSYATGPSVGTAATVSPAEEKRRRRAYGGNLVPPSYTQPRWVLADIDEAQVAADRGDLRRAAQLWKSCQTDPTVAGVLGTRTGGLVRLPMKWRGPQHVVDLLERGHKRPRSRFDEMCPPSELCKLSGDAVGLGVAVGELVPVRGRSYPVLVRLPHEFLLYRWTDATWYYRGIGGLVPITPGDGRWVLHVTGPRLEPWTSGAWAGVGRSYIHKSHAGNHDQLWQAKLAHPARVAYAPTGSTGPERLSFFRQVLGWGPNSAFGLIPGWDVKLLESNGRGHESFRDTIERSDREFMIAIAGQVVTTEGGAGFSNANVHESIRDDLVQADAEALAYTINTQILPAYVATHYGEEALDDCPVLAWNVEMPKERNQEAQALLAVGQALAQLREGLGAHGLQLDAGEFVARMGVPVLGDSDGDGRPDSDGLEEDADAPKLLGDGGAEVSPDEPMNDGGGDG